MKFLGMPVWKRKTDEQIIGQIRKSRKVMLWTIGIETIFAIIILVSGIYVANNLSKIVSPTYNPIPKNMIHGDKAAQITAMMKETSDNHSDISQFYLGLVIGASVYGFLVWYITHVIESIAAILIGRRKDRLLLQCWDAIHAEEKYS